MFGVSSCSCTGAALLRPNLFGRQHLQRAFTASVNRSDHVLLKFHLRSLSARAEAPRFSKFEKTMKALDTAKTRA